MTKAICTIILIIVHLLCTAMWIAILLSEESGTTMISQLHASKELIMPCSKMTQVVLTEVNRRQPGHKK
jgi:preprotein translocase subunit SecG